MPTLSGTTESILQDARRFIFLRGLTSMFVLSTFYQLLRSLLVPRLVLVTENLALRQQLLVLQRSTNRPRHRDRLLRIALSQLWQDWRSILVMVKPETVVKWHRQVSSAIGAGSPDWSRRTPQD